VFSCYKIKRLTRYIKERGTERNHKRQKQKPLLSFYRPFTNECPMASQEKVAQVSKLKMASSFCIPRFSSCTSTILNILRLTLTSNLKMSTMLDFLCHWSSLSLNINHLWRIFVAVRGKMEEYIMLPKYCLGCRDKSKVFF